MKKKRTIRQKITKLLLCMVFAALFFTGAVSLLSLYSMRAVSEENNSILGQTAAGDAQEALEEMAGEQLLSVAVQKAEYIDEKFNTVISCLKGITQAAEDIYRNPQEYPDRNVALPVKGSSELAAQLLWSENLGEGIMGDLPDKQLSEILKLGNLQDMLVQYNANNDMISSTYIATQSGWMMQADYISYSKYSGNSDIPDFYEAGTRQWYQRALSAEMGETVYTDVMEDIHEGKDCIVCASPIYLNGKIVAVAGVGSYLDTVNDAVLNTAIGESGYAFLVNERGQIMVSGVQSGETMADASKAIDIRESTNENLAQAAKDMVGGGSGLMKLTIDDKAVYLAYAPLEGLGWSFVTVMDVEEVVAPAKESQQEILALTEVISSKQKESIRRTLFIFLIIVLAAAVLISIVSIVFTKKLTDPIHRLTAEVTRIDGGNLEKRIQITTGDEVQELGNAFNDMTAQLQKYIGNLAAVTAEKERIRTEIQVASRLQADMLPEANGAFADREEFALYASMTPAKGVGGDFYDFFLLDENHLALVMADVSGKGVPAALFMVVSRTLIRSRLMTGIVKGEPQENMLEKTVEEINKSLCDNNKNGMFVTAWIGVLTLSSGRLDFVNAGHCHPLILHRNGTCSYETSLGGFVLAGMEDSKYRQSCIRMKQGDTLLLYTDGVTEATNADKELYGEERLKNIVESSDTFAPQKLLQEVWKDVYLFQKGMEQFDDITMLAIAYQGSGFAEMSGIPDINYIREFEGFVEENLKERNISMKNILKLQMTVDEILSNICYYSGATEVTVGVRVQEEDKNTGEKNVTLYFEDDGIPYNPLERPDPKVDEPAQKRKEGGLGIYLVRKRMDYIEYKYEDERNHLTISKKDAA